MGDLQGANGGGAAVGERLVPSPSPPPSEPNPSEIGWDRAEKAAHKIICTVQPTSLSEERRREVVDYIQRLIRNCLGVEVFPYGSVPLKTYLPDGDIDLTSFGGASVEDQLANDMKSILEEEERNRAAEFVVKDVQLICAEVKLVKCIVQNIVVDISFNQIGGLCTLCFLEQVDRLIGKNHLFKRSIILIKAWCYYESRILGAHHGLISTYALETLVLYIFHLFHSTLNGPLAVLYKFLDYFSKFDWDTYCISLNGPVQISSLPAIVAERPEDGGGPLLLTDDFLRFCIESFSVPSGFVDNKSREFRQKHLNIVDPLKESNNLGRSIGKGNSYRIRSAFSYGAKKLGQILAQPEDDIAKEIHNFFSSTMQRHGCAPRPVVQDPYPPSTCNGFIPLSSGSGSESCKYESYANCVISTGDHRFESSGSSQGLTNDMKAFGMGKPVRADREHEAIWKANHLTALTYNDQHVKPRAAGHRLLTDSNDLATSSIEGLQISSDSPEFKNQALKESVSAIGMPPFAPHLYFSALKFLRGNMNKGIPNSDQWGKCEKNIPSAISSGYGEGRVGSGGSLDNNQFVYEDEVVDSISKRILVEPKSASSSDDLDHMNWVQGSASRSGSPESSNSLSDLSGDYDSHFNCLEYGRWFYECASGVPSLPRAATPPLQYQNKNPWDGGLYPSQLRQNGFFHGHANGFIPSPVVYSMHHVLVPGVAFGGEEMPKPRGTGTYFPKMNQSPQGYRSSAVKGKNRAASSSPRDNRRSMTFLETNLVDRSSHEQSQPQVPVDQIVNLGSFGTHQFFSPRGNVNGLVIQPEVVVESGSAGQVPFGTLFPERSRQQRPASSSPQIPSPASPGMQKPKPALSRNEDR